MPSSWRRPNQNHTSDYQHAEAGGEEHDLVRRHVMALPPNMFSAIQPVSSGAKNAPALMPM